MTIIRNLTLEEAAKACEGLEGRIDYTDMDEYRMIALCASAIRGLKNAAPQVPGSCASTGTDGEGAASSVRSSEPLSQRHPLDKPAEAALSSPRRRRGCITFKGKQMNEEEFVGKFLAFKGEDEYIGEKNVLMQVTDTDGSEVELAFTAPLPGSPRFYIRFPLPLVVANVMPEKKK